MTSGHANQCVLRLALDLRNSRMGWVAEAGETTPLLRALGRMPALRDLTISCGVALPPQASSAKPGDHGFVPGLLCQGQNMVKISSRIRSMYRSDGERLCLFLMSHNERKK